MLGNARLGWANTVLYPTLTYSTLPYPTLLYSALHIAHRSDQHLTLHTSHTSESLEQLCYMQYCVLHRTSILKLHDSYCAGAVTCE